MALYLVTGGCGFIGSHLSDALIEAGHSVRILDDMSSGKVENLPAGAELVVGDVADPNTVAGAMQGVAGCFHLAAVASVEQSKLDWLGTHRTNLTGSITVFNAARRVRGGTGVPVVYASSAAVYGDNPNTPLAETADKRPMSAYGADKLGSEQHGLIASRIHNVPTCGLRFFNVYGPRQDPSSPYSGVISIFCDRLSNGQDIQIFGDGCQTRDFVFVGDVVRALMAAMDGVSTKGEVYNVCTGRKTSILELAHLVASILGVSINPIFAAERTGEIRCSFGDPERARLALAVTAQTDLRTGLRTLLVPEPLKAPATGRLDGYYPGNGSRLQESLTP
jgi:UDP-glucose 4-epimerase